MFIDESGFYLLPLLVRSFTPIRQTPFVQTPLIWEHLLVIGAVTREKEPSSKCTIMRSEDLTWCGSCVIYCAISPAS